MGWNIGQRGCRPEEHETSLECWGEQMVDNSRLSGRGALVSLVINMTRSGLGKGLGTLMEPAPGSGKATQGPEGAVRLFLKTPEKPTEAPVVPVEVEHRRPISADQKREESWSWVSGTLFVLDAALVILAGLLLGIGTVETGKVLLVGGSMIGVAAILGVMGVVLRRRD